MRIEYVSQSCHSDGGRIGFSPKEQRKTYLPEPSYIAIDIAWDTLVCTTKSVIVFIIGQYKIRSRADTKYLRRFTYQSVAAASKLNSCEKISMRYSSDFDMTANNELTHP